MVYHQKLQVISDLFLFGAAGFLLTTGSHIVDIMYDHRYHDAGHMLEILSLGLIGFRYTIVEQYCMAIGAMNYLVFATVCRLLTLFIGLPFGYHLAGINGALIAIVCSQFANWPIAIYIKFKYNLINMSLEFIGVPVMVLMAGVGWELVHLIEWAKGG